MTTEKIGLMVVYNDARELVAVIHKDEKSHKNIFFSCSEMDMTQIEHLLTIDTSKIK